MLSHPQSEVTGTLTLPVLDICKSKASTWPRSNETMRAVVLWLRHLPCLLQDGSWKTHFRHYILLVLDINDIFKSGKKKTDNTKILGFLEKKKRGSQLSQTTCKEARDLRAGLLSKKRLSHRPPGLGMSSPDMWGGQYCEERDS